MIVGVGRPLMKFWQLQNVPWNGDRTQSSNHSGAPMGMKVENWPVVTLRLAGELLPMLAVVPY